MCRAGMSALAEDVRILDVATARLVDETLRCVERPTAGLTRGSLRLPAESSLLRSA